MQILEAGKTTIYCLAFTPEGEVVVGTKNGQVIKLSAMAEPAKLMHLQMRIIDPISIHALSMTASGALAIGSDLGAIRLSRADFDIEVIELGETAGILCVDHLDEHTFVLGEGNRNYLLPGSLALWTSKAPPHKLKPFFQESKGVKAVAVHRPSRIVAWANGSNRITIWDPQRQDPKHLNLGASSPSLAFHPDGKALAVALKWGVKLYDITKLYEVQSFDGHKGRVTSVAFSLDGRVMATGSWDKTVRLWNAENGKLIAAYEGPTGKVYTLSYSPDGLRLAAAGDAGNVVIWDVD